MKKSAFEPALVFLLVLSPLMLMFLVLACQQPRREYTSADNIVSVYVDSDYQVTCWLANSGISCIPNSLVVKK